MLLDLDNCSIYQFKLGEQVEFGDGLHEMGCFSIFVENSKVKALNVRFSEFFSQGEIYKKDVVINSIPRALPLNPKAMLSLFEKIESSFDDGVEVNYQFKKNDISIEVSWNKKDSNLTLNYISLEHFY